MMTQSSTYTSNASDIYLSCIIDSKINNTKITRTETNIWLEMDYPSVLINQVDI